MQIFAQLSLRTKVRTVLLLSKTELVDDSTVTLDVYLCKVSKEVSSVTNHLKKTSTAVVVVLVNLKMLVKVVDTACKKCDLYFWLSKPRDSACRRHRKEDFRSERMLPIRVYRSSNSTSSSNAYPQEC